MTSLRTLLDDLAGSVGAAAAMAPDEYDPGLAVNYQNNMADIKELWATARPRIHRDLDKAEILDRQLFAMFTAFEMGNKKLGREIAWDIYNSKPEKLR